MRGVSDIEFMTADCLASPIWCFRSINQLFLYTAVFGMGILATCSGGPRLIQNTGIKNSPETLNGTKGILDVWKKEWRILTIWECALVGRNRLPVDSVIETASQWLLSQTGHLEIEGL